MTEAHAPDTEMSGGRKSSQRRPTWLKGLLALPIVVCAASGQARAQISLPAVNLGDTSFLDAAAGPGWLFEETVSVYEASSFRDDDGDRAPAPDDLQAIAVVTHVAYLSEHRLLGANLGAEMLLPIVRTELDVAPGVGDSRTGVGDLIVAPLILQWSDRSLLGRPLHARLNLNVTLPTGDYDRDRLVNVGQGSVRFNPYLALTWLPSREWEISGRFHYLWTSENDEPSPGVAEESLQPGQAVHFNLAASRAVSDRVRVGVSGYFLQQISDDRADGVRVENSRERVAGIGPGLMLTAGRSMFYANAYVEAFAQNRPSGMRLTFRYLRPF
jgi:hypothetical protein